MEAKLSVGCSGTEVAPGGGHELPADASVPSAAATKTSYPVGTVTSTIVLTES